MGRFNMAAQIECEEGYQVIHFCGQSARPQALCFMTVKELSYFVRFSGTCVIKEPSLSFFEMSSIMDTFVSVTTTTTITTTTTGGAFLFVGHLMNVTTVLYDRVVCSRGNDTVTKQKLNQRKHTQSHPCGVGISI